MTYRDKLELAARVQALFSDYVDCIDGGRFEEWPALFTETCLYKVTSRDNYERGLPVGLIFCDSRAMLIDRVKALREANIYEEHRYRHLIGPTTIVGRTADRDVEARTGFLVVRTMRDGQISLFASGEYIDRIAFPSETEPPLFREKLVVCDSQRIDTLLVLPL